MILYNYFYENNWILNFHAHTYSREKEKEKKKKKDQRTKGLAVLFGS